MDTGKRVVRNSLLGIASQAIGGGAYFFASILIARHLGPVFFGAFTFIFALVTAFHLLADFGLTNILVKEISRNKTKVHTILAAVIPFATVIAICTFALLALSALLFVESGAAFQATLVLGASVLITFHAAVFASVCRAFEEMEYNAIGLIGQRIVLVVAIVVAIVFDQGLVAIALCYLMERIFQWLYFYCIVRSRYCTVNWKPDLNYCLQLMRQGIPLGAGMILRRLTWHIDIFILMAISSANAVGLFSAAYRVVQMLNVIPFTLSTPVFPVLSRMAKESPAKAFEFYQGAQKIFLLIAMPVGFWLLLMGAQVTTLLFGQQFSAASATLQIMGAVIIVIFLNSLYVFLFSALEKQSYFMQATAVCVLVNAVLDLVLIPFLGINGAALATLLAELALFASGVLLLRAAGFKITLAIPFAKTTVAAVLGGLVLIWPLFNNGLVSLIIASSLYFCFYTLFALRFKVLSDLELETLCRALPFAKNSTVQSLIMRSASS